jgi:tRNA dimethylallyltransferase
MQIYKEMDIGTAKATPEEQKEIRHHMIDVISPEESFSAKAYRDMALPIAEDIVSRGKIPLFVGGTGLYLTTLIRNDTQEVPESDPEYRQRIESKIQSEEDKKALHDRLREVDPESAELIHYNNLRRVIRALEIYDATGKPKSYFDKLSRLPSEDISLVHVTLDFHNRDLLYARADERVDAMMSEGLMQEVASLLCSGKLEESFTSAQAIGYKEIIRAIKGDVTLEAAIDDLKQATRNYAKRQLTWFRHDESAVKLWVDGEDGKPRGKDELFAECLSVFQKEINKQNI